MGTNVEPDNKIVSLRPEIVRGVVTRLTIYEISETELERLEQGAPASLCLSFAIFLLSVSLSFLANLMITPISSNRVFTVYVVVTVVGLVVGAFLLCAWIRSYRSVSELVRTIKNRLPPEGLPAICETENSGIARHDSGLSKC
jgi:uncharacterized membrane protein YqjE